MTLILTRLGAAVLATSLIGQAAPAMAQRAAPPPPAEQQRQPARVYLIRGLFDVFSLGMDRLGSHLRRDGHAARVYGAASADALTAEIIARRRVEPGDYDDLLTMLLGARDEETGEGMSDRQLRDEMMTILLAGFIAVIVISMVTAILSLNELVA